MVDMVFRSLLLGESVFIRGALPVSAKQYASQPSRLALEFFCCPGSRGPWIKFTNISTEDDTKHRFLSILGFPT